MSPFFEKYYEDFGFIYPDYPQDQELGERQDQIQQLRLLATRCTRSRALFLKRADELETSDLISSLV